GILVVSEVLAEASASEDLHTVQDRGDLPLQSQEVLDGKTAGRTCAGYLPHLFSSGFFLEDHGVGVAEIRVGVLREQRHLAAQFPREKAVVRVEEAHIARLT